MIETTRSFPVKNMTCAACARSVENMLKFTPGVTDAVVNYASASVNVRYNSQQVDFKTMQAQVQAIGYDLIEEIDIDALRADKERAFKTAKLRLLVAVVFAVPVFLLSMVFTNVPHSAVIQFVLSLPVVIFSGGHFYVSALKKGRHGQFTMDTLIALGTGAAMLLSIINTFFVNGQSELMQNHVYYESAVVIITLILVGQFIEERAKSATTQAIEQLMRLQPATAVRLVNGKAEEIAVDDVRLDDQLRIAAGAKIPVDGVVVSGQTEVDESMLTGESVLVAKTVGDQFFAGTINGSGAIVMKATQIGAGTALAGIIRMVQQAQGSKAPAQKLADKISGIFVPTVMAIALLAGSIWYFLGPAPAFLNAFTITITVLIIACPCALGLATPTAITAGIGQAAKQGILVKDAQTLEQLKDVDVLLIDKTGTLTMGKPRVLQAEWFDQSVGLKPMLAMAEAQSQHPLAAAVIDSLGQNTATIEVPFTVKEIAGVGLTWQADGKTFYAGKVRNENAVLNTQWRKTKLAQLHAKNATLIEFSDEHSTHALFALKDELKPNAKQAVKQIQANGIDVIMLTGDKRGMAQELAQKVGINHVEAELLPEQKAAIVKQTQQAGKKVAMVGDGINDAPALALADVGMAMSTGTEVAMQSAGITLLKGDVSKIERAIHLSSAASAVIRQNLFWAFFYNIIAIPVAAGVLFPLNGFLLNPMVAGGAMALSSVTVVANSLRLKVSKQQNLKPNNIK